MQEELSADPCLAGLAACFGIIPFVGFLCYVSFDIDMTRLLLFLFSLFNDLLFYAMLCVM